MSAQVGSLVAVSIHLCVCRIWILFFGVPITAVSSAKQLFSTLFLTVFVCRFLSRRMEKLEQPRKKMYVQHFRLLLKFRNSI